MGEGALVEGARDRAATALAAVHRFAVEGAPRGSPIAAGLPARRHHLLQHTHSPKAASTQRGTLIGACPLGIGASVHGDCTAVHRRLDAWPRHAAPLAAGGPSRDLRQQAQVHGAQQGRAPSLARGQQRFDLVAPAVSPDCALRRAAPLAEHQPALSRPHPPPGGVPRCAAHLRERGRWVRAGAARGARRSCARSCALSPFLHPRACPALSSALLRPAVPSLAVLPVHLSHIHPASCPRGPPQRPHPRGKRSRLIRRSRGSPARAFPPTCAHGTVRTSSAARPAGSPPGPFARRS